jgi:Tfp pilus assembly protein PilF
VSIHELARYYLSQRKTVRAAGLMIKLIETEPTPENLTLLAEIYMQQGLVDDAAALYLRVVKAGLSKTRMHEQARWA